MHYLIISEFKNSQYWAGNEDLMAKFCKEAIATDQWARDHQEPGTDLDCGTCELGSTTAFFASGIKVKLFYLQRVQ